MAWSRPLGQPVEGIGRPRVDYPMIDDGEWAGVPIGGLGAGSIGPTIRGDFARWHLRVGRHRFLPVAADGFALSVATATGRWAGPLAVGTAPTLPAFGPALPVGSGTYRALFPRAWSVYDGLPVPVRATCEQLSPVVPGDEATSALPVGLFRWTFENTGPTRATVGLLFTFRDPRGEESGETPAAGAWSELVRRAGSAGVLLHGAPGTPAELGGTFAIAVETADDVDVRVRTRFDPDTGADAWAEFGADGRLRNRDDRRTTAAGDTVAAAVSATVELEPGASRTITFSLAWDLPIVEFGGGRRWRKRYTDEWGTSGLRAYELASHGLGRMDAWRAAIEAWQGPVLADPGRPDWYKAALFNELYYLVDGGTFWGTELDPPAGSRMARLAIGSGSWSASTTRTTTRSTSTSTPRSRSSRCGRTWSWPTMRDVVEAVPIDDPTLVTIRSDGHRAIRKVAGDRGPRRRRAGRGPVPSAEPLRLPGREHLEGPGAQVRAPGLARLHGDRRPSDARGELAGHPGRPRRTGRSRPRRGRVARTRRDAGPDVRHLADARPERVRRLALAGRPPGGRGDRSRARAKVSARRPTATGSNAARRASSAGCGPATTTATTTAAA